MIGRVWAWVKRVNRDARTAVFAPRPPVFPQDTLVRHPVLAALALTCSSIVWNRDSTPAVPPGSSRMTE